MDGFAEWQRLMQKKYGKNYAPGGGAAVVKQLAPNAFDDVAFFITLTFSALFASQPDLEIYCDGELIDTPTKEGALPGSSFKYKLTRIVPAGKCTLKFPEKKKDITDSPLTVKERVWNKVAFNNLSMGTQHVILNSAKDAWITAPFEIVDKNTGNLELPIPWRFDFFFDKRSEKFFFFVSKINEQGLGMGPNTQTSDPGLITLDESADTFWLRHSQFDVDREIWRNTGDSMAGNGVDILGRFSNGYDRRYCMLAYDGFDLIYLDSDVSTIPYYDPAAPVIRIPTKTPLAKITWIWRDSSNDGSDLEIGWYTPTYAQDSFV